MANTCSAVWCRGSACERLFVLLGAPNIVGEGFRFPPIFVLQFGYSLFPFACKGLLPLVVARACFGAFKCLTYAV